MSAGNADVVVVGGGIAGVAVAAQLSCKLRVVILERENQPGYHTTGRSAATFSAIYGNVSIRALSRASRSFFFDPPADFSVTPLITRRGSLFVACADQVSRLDAFAALPAVADATERMSAKEVRRLCPLLRASQLQGGLHEPGAADVDVHALLHGYLGQVRRLGSRLFNNAEVLGMERTGDNWCVHSTAGEFHAPIVINAAGAWVDRIAKLSGASPIGIEPLRRTVAIVDAPTGVDISAWPTIIDIDEQWYFKPDAGRILLSPADETPSVPCDAMPDDWEVALAVDRIEAATTLSVTHLRQKWAGLRCFVADRSPVVGYDAALPGFFWLAALGGYGIQTAPAMGRMAAELVLGHPIPRDIRAMGLDAASLAPGRLAPDVSDAGAC